MFRKRNLIAFTDDAKNKTMATVNLKTAIAVEDTQDARSAASNSDGRHNSLIAVERSFRLVFPSEKEFLLIYLQFRTRMDSLHIL